MPEMLMLYEPGDRFATMASNGRAYTYTVLDNGTLLCDQTLEPKPVDLVDNQPEEEPDGGE